MRRWPILMFCFTASCALGMGPFSPATTGEHSSERTSSTNAAGEQAGYGKVWVSSVTANSSFGALLGVRYGPTLVSLDGHDRMGWGLGGHVHLDTMFYNSNWGIGLVTSFGSAGGAVKQGDVKYSGWAFTPTIVHSLGPYLCFHFGVGLDYAGVSVLPFGGSDSDSSDWTPGLRAQLGLTLSGSDYRNSFGLRLGASFQRSGSLHVLGGDTNVTAWAFSLEPIYGAF
jgi:hypothetical protein